MYSGIHLTQPGDVREGFPEEMVLEPSKTKSSFLGRNERGRRKEEPKAWKQLVGWEEPWAESPGLGV